MSRVPCSAFGKAGEPCKAFAMPDDRYCWTHSPAHAEDRRRACSAGGRKATQLRAIEGRRRKLDNPRALAAFLSNLVHDLVEQKVEAELVKTVAYSISVQCKVLDLARQSDVEQALAEVRQLTAEARRRA